jgi:hypothetical protein
MQKNLHTSLLHLLVQAGTLFLTIHDHIKMLNSGVHPPTVGGVIMIMDETNSRAPNWDNDIKKGKRSVSVVRRKEKMSIPIPQEEKTQGCRCLDDTPLLTLEP